MSNQLKATTPDSLAETVAFLRGVYHASSDSPNFNPDLLAWKYYQPGPEWEGSRSFVLRKEDAILAHGSVWPVRLATPAGTVMAVRVLDWASSASGDGRCADESAQQTRRCDSRVGGSEDTLRVLPAMGFKHRGTARIYARVSDHGVSFARGLSMARGLYPGYCATRAGAVRRLPLAPGGLARLLCHPLLTAAPRTIPNPVTARISLHTCCVVPERQ